MIPGSPSVYGSSSITPQVRVGEEGVAAALEAIRNVQDRTSENSTVANIVLSSDMLEMRSARTLKDKLEQALVAGRPCRIDGSAVERVSTGGAQVLIAFFAAMKQAGIEAALLRPSASLRSGIDDLGFGDGAVQWIEE